MLRDDLAISHHRAQGCLEADDCGGVKLNGGVVNKPTLPKLRALSLGLLVPGLLGLITSTCVSTHYMNNLPRYPDADTQRLTPRNINGYIVYQTEREDRALDVMEYSSVAIFLMGLTAGLLYLQKWGLARAVEPDEDESTGEGEDEAAVS